MITLRKAYRFRMRPTAEQREALSVLANARRYVWNWGLARKREHYATAGRSLRYPDLNKELTALKRQPGMEWLQKADAQSLQEALRDLERAFAGFFAKRWRYPQFKSKKRDRDRFRIFQGAKIADGKVYCPKIGWIKIRQSQTVAEKPKNATFKQSADGKWYVAVLVEFEMPDVSPVVAPEKVVGIDLGLIDFATPSDGSKPIPAPRFFRKSQRKLRSAQRVFSRRKLGSKRRAKAKTRVARIHQRISNQRGDFLHNLTARFVAGHDTICIEDLALRGLARTKLAKSFRDASFGEFRRQLEYKCLWNHRSLVAVDRFFPSSKLCRGCGEINGSLTLKDRLWVCECGMVHDRDLSAAVNIRDEGLRILAAGQAERLNARGVDVRPAKAG